MYKYSQEEVEDLIYSYRLHEYIGGEIVLTKRDRETIARVLYKWFNQNEG